VSYPEAGVLSHTHELYPYVRMDDPLGSGGYTVSRGRPPYGELGREISLESLPEGCKNLVLDMYQKVWNL
jgi:hypothetical protein